MVPWLCRNDNIGPQLHPICNLSTQTRVLHTLILERMLYGTAWSDGILLWTHCITDCLLNDSYTEVFDLVFVSSKSRRSNFFGRFISLPPNFSWTLRRWRSSSLASISFCFSCFSINFFLTNWGKSYLLILVWYRLYGYCSKALIQKGKSKAVICLLWGQIWICFPRKNWESNCCYECF